MNEKIIYKLTVEDFQAVANTTFGRNLTEEEINLLSQEIGEYIDWYGAIENAMINLNIK